MKKEEIEKILSETLLEATKDYVLLTKQECLALVEAYDTAYVAPESTLANQAYRKIYKFATQK